jgi:hypothetical protein
MLAISLLARGHARLSALAENLFYGGPWDECSWVCWHRNEYGRFDPSQLPPGAKVQVRFDNEEDLPDVAMLTLAKGELTDSDENR